MRISRFVCAAIAAGVVVVASVAPQAEDVPYAKPPQAIVDILDAPPLPSVSIGPTRRTIALLARDSMPSIGEVSAPMLRLAGLRINPRTNGPHRPGGIVAITFKYVATGTERKVALPADVAVQDGSFAPDGSRYAFTVVKPNGLELWMADTATGQAKALSGATLNAIVGPPCDWLPDSRSLACRFVPSGRGAAPAPAGVPAGPNVQETAGKASPAPTYQDLLETSHDEARFEHYATAQLAVVDAASGQTTSVGKPAIFDTVEVSPNAEFLLVARAKRPFSRLVPVSGFPKDVEIWNRRGDVVKTIASLPSTEGVPILGVPTGPRAYRWNPTEPATLVWVEALDGGDLRTKAAQRDKVVRLPAPFTGSPAEVARTEHRFATISWTEQKVALLTESERQRRRVVTWILDGSAQPRKLWDRSQEDRYNDPGSPMTRPTSSGSVVLQHGDSIFLSGQGASPEGARPFLDRLNLKTGETARLFRTGETSYEPVVALLEPDGSRILTQHETKTDPPNYFVRQLPNGERRALTAFQDPAPALAKVQKQMVTYTRADGLPLSGTLYLPPDHKPGTRLPVVLWAYPREFTDPGAAGQVTGSPNRFTMVRGASHLLLLTQGYAIFDDPAMPIVGSGETANDTYVEQLVASAEAAVKTIVEMGVADRDRVGVGGHSYGAFMTANLLAHSDIFRAGIARSGAYNRTLTPFGFQAERRTFWEVPEIYAKMSPFFHAHKINEPILLIHGEADDNSGTFPIQSERLYMALKGHGATVRYVTLPHESHGYAARESVLHTVAEMLKWMDQHVKSAGPRGTTDGR